MMEVSPSIRGSRIASLVTRLAGSDGPGRALSGGSLAVVLLSTVGSIVAYGMVPEQLRIHWTFGMGPYYGPEFAPRLLVLTLFPVLVAGTAALARWIDARARHSAAFDAVRPYYVVAMVGTLGVLFVSQVAVVAANL